TSPTTSGASRHTDRTGASNKARKKLFGEDVKKSFKGSKFEDKDRSRSLPYTPKEESAGRRKSTDRPFSDKRTDSKFKDSKNSGAENKFSDGKRAGGDSKYSGNKRQGEKPYSKSAGKSFRSEDRSERPKYRSDEGKWSSEEKF